MSQKRRILFLRHAKSDWDAAHSLDADRPLNDRGRKTARRMGELLAASGQVPELALVSSAVRARETFELASAAGAWNCESRIEPGLYASSPRRVLDILRAQNDAIPSLLLVGHEPTWSELAGALVGGAHLRFPTGALARLDFRVESWNQLDYDRGNLVWLLQPKFFTNFPGIRPLSTDSTSV